MIGLLMAMSIMEPIFLCASLLRDRARGAKKDKLGEHEGRKIAGRICNDAPLCAVEGTPATAVADVRVRANGTQVVDGMIPSGTQVVQGISPNGQMQPQQIDPTVQWQCMCMCMGTMPSGTQDGGN